MKHISKNTFVHDAGLSVRAHNVLLVNSDHFGIESIPGKPRRLKIKHLRGHSARMIATFRNCGLKTMAEIKELCTRAGVKLEK